MFGSLLLLLVVAALFVGGYVYMHALDSQVDIDQATLCPKKDGQIRPVGYAAILIDTSDELPIVQRTNAASELAEMVNRLPQGWRLSIYRLDSDVSKLPQPSIVLCNPGSGEELDRISGNPELARRRWLKEFVEPMSAAVVDAVSSGESKTSPIMENIAGVAAADLATPAAREAPRRLILLSDMLQFSSIASQYRGLVSFDKFSKTPEYNRVRTDLSGAEITIFYIDRSQSVKISWDQHIRFWEQYFEAQGASLERVRRILG